MTASLTDATTATTEVARSTELYQRAEARTAHNYHPLPVVVEHAEAPG